MGNPKAKTVKLLLEDGTLKGVMSIVDSNWNPGEMYVAPRESIDSLLSTDACCKFGVYLLLSEKLSTLTHRLICHEEINFCFNIDRFYEKEDLLSMSFNLDGLSDLRHVEISTRKLVDIDRLFQDEKGNM